MKSITKFTAIGFPAFIGLGLAWIGHRIMSNEKRLEIREFELQKQLDRNEIKNL